MLYKLNRKGVNKISDITTNTKIGEQLFVEINCNINNLLLHKAQLLNRKEYNYWFKGNLKRLSHIANMKDDFFNGKDFDYFECFLLNKQGKEKLKNDKISSDDFRERCLIVERSFKECFFKTFDKNFKLSLYGKEFCFNDFY